MPSTEWQRAETMDKITNMTKPLAPKNKTPMGRPKKLALWIGGSIVGLFAIIMIIGTISIANTPGGWETVRAEQAAAASAKADEKATAAQAKAAEEATAEQARAAEEASAQQAKADEEAEAKELERLESEAASAEAAQIEAQEKAKKEAEAEQARTEAAAEASKSAEAAKAKQEAAAAKQQAPKPAPKPKTVEAPAKKKAADPKPDGRQQWADSMYKSWLTSMGVKRPLEILEHSPASIQGFVNGVESPSTGTLVFTVQVTQGEVDKAELERSAMAMLQIIGYDHSDVDRVELVTADSLKRAVANRRDSPLLNR